MKHQHSEDVARSLDHARLALAGNLLADALEHVREALRLDPDHTEARVLEARIRLRRHEPRLALTALDSRDHVANPAPGSTPDPNGKPSPDVTMLRATALAANGKVDLAVTIMESLAQEFPDDAGVLRALAGMQVHDRRSQDAAETLGRVIELEPSDRAAARLRSDLLAASDPAAALEALGPIDATNRGRAARLCRKTERLAEAEMHYAELLATLNAEGAGQADLRREAAEVAEVMGENHRALDRLAGALDTENLGSADAAAAWCHTGRLNLNAGRWGEAAWAYRQATRHQPELAEAWTGLVTTAHAAGRARLQAKADRKLRSLTERDERRRLLATLYPHTLGAPNHQAETEAAQTHSPLQRMLAEAVVVMHKVAERHPGRADVHYHHAVCNLARGEAADAGDAVEKALAINPNYAAAQALAERVGVGHDDELLPLNEH